MSATARAGRVLLALTLTLPAGLVIGAVPAGAAARTGAPVVRTTSYDLPKISPELRKTSPDLRKTSPDLRKTSPDLRKT